MKNCICKISKENHVYPHVSCVLYKHAPEVQNWWFLIIFHIKMENTWLIWASEFALNIFLILVLIIYICIYIFQEENFVSEESLFTDQEQKSERERSSICPDYTQSNTTQTLQKTKGPSVDPSKKKTKGEQDEKISKPCLLTALHGYQAASPPWSYLSSLTFEGPLLFFSSFCVSRSSSLSSEISFFPQPSIAYKGRHVLLFLSLIWTLAQTKS